MLLVSGKRRDKIPTPIFTPAKIMNGIAGLTFRPCKYGRTKLDVFR